MSWFWKGKQLWEPSGQNFKKKYLKKLSRKCPDTEYKRTRETRYCGNSISCKKGSWDPPKYGIPTLSYKPNIKSLAFIVAEKNATQVFCALTSKTELKQYTLLFRSGGLIMFWINKQYHYMCDIHETEFPSRITLNCDSDLSAQVM